MRIISQDGSLDIPYDISAIELDTYFRDDEESTAVFTRIFVRTMDAYKSIARYSTEEKAIKSMEMCRYAYGLNEHIFRFPQDEEVEV